jgi:hypothetical protein
MKEFVLLFRQPTLDYDKVSEEERNALTKKWQEWIGNIDGQGQLSNYGMRLSTDGKVLKPGGVITDGPFVEIRERLGGFIVVRAETIEDATTIAHGCPALEKGGTVEIRPIFMMKP